MAFKRVSVSPFCPTKHRVVLRFVDNHGDQGVRLLGHLDRTLCLDKTGSFERVDCLSAPIGRADYVKPTVENAASHRHANVAQANEPHTLDHFY